MKYDIVYIPTDKSKIIVKTLIAEPTSNIYVKLLPNVHVFTEDELKERDGEIYAKVLGIKKGGYVLYTKEENDRMKNLISSIKDDVDCLANRK